MATNFSHSSGSYVLNKFPSISQWSDTGPSWPSCSFLAPNLKITLPLLKRQILDSSKLREFADDNFKLDENGRQFSKRVENTAGKGEIARYEQFLLFPECF